MLAASVDESLARVKQEASLLAKLLKRNRNQHRRCLHFKRLSMTSAGLARLERETTRLGVALTDASPDVNHRASEKLIVSCSLVEHAGRLCMTSAAALTDLISRTHFVAFSLAALGILARLRALLSHLLLGLVNMYNSREAKAAVPSSSARQLPDMLGCSWGVLLFQKVTATFADPTKADRSGIDEVDLDPGVPISLESIALKHGRGETLESEEEREQCLPIIDDVSLSGRSASGVGRENTRGNMRMGSMSSMQAHGEEAASDTRATTSAIEAQGGTEPLPKKAPASVKRSRATVEDSGGDGVAFVRLGKGSSASTRSTVGTPFVRRRKLVGKHTDETLEIDDIFASLNRQR